MVKKPHVNLPPPTNFSRISPTPQKTSTFFTPPPIKVIIIIPLTLFCPYKSFINLNLKFMNNYGFLIFLVGSPYSSVSNSIFLLPLDFFRSFYHSNSLTLISLNTYRRRNLPLHVCRENFLPSHSYTYRYHSILIYNSTL